MSKGTVLFGDDDVLCNRQVHVFHGADPYGVYSDSGTQKSGISYAESTSSIPSGNNYKSVSVSWKTSCSLGTQGRRQRRHGLQLIRDGPRAAAYLRRRLACRRSGMKILTLVWQNMRRMFTRHFTTLFVLFLGLAVSATALVRLLRAERLHAQHPDLLYGDRPFSGV